MRKGLGLSFVLFFSNSEMHLCKKSKILYHL